MSPNFDITVLTATLGRPSLKAVARDLEKQTVRPAEWILFCDGAEARQSIEDKNLLAPYKGSTYVYTEEPAIHMEPFELIFRHLDMITTKYVTFIDDDNRYSRQHIAAFKYGLELGHPLVSVLRHYAVQSGNNLEILGPEHPGSEQVDTSCMAMETELLREVAAHAKLNFRHYRKFPFQDRQMISYFFSCGIPCVKISDAYTVTYRVNPKRMDPNRIRGIMLRELLLGDVISYELPKK
jgi:hypothetical protein